MEEPTDAALSPDEQAEKLMKLARLYAENRLYGKAREKLKQLVKDFPKSKFVPEAERMLKEIGRG